MQNCLLNPKSFLVQRHPPHTHVHTLQVNMVKFPVTQELQGTIQRWEGGTALVIISQTPPLLSR